MKAKRAVFLCYVTVILTVILFGCAQEIETTSVQSPEFRATIDEARQWLWENPPNGINATERRKRMAIIQKACDAVGPTDFGSYEESWWVDKDRADQLEEQHPVLYYLRKATLCAMEDIRHTRVEQGLVIWYLYNMGHVFKTPESCFGIDITGRDVEMLAEEFDFLLISHEHSDHFSEALIKAMIVRGKPVVTRWFEGSTIVDKGTEIRFGKTRVKVDIGPHGRGDLSIPDSMLMFQVDCGPAANDAVIYHSGDGGGYEKMRPDKPVDVLIVHTQVGMSVREAVRHLKPKLTIASHVLELGHDIKPPYAYRWSFDYAFRTIRRIPEKESMILTWGERWLLPGTTLK